MERSGHAIFQAAGRCMPIDTMKLSKVHQLYACLWALKKGKSGLGCLLHTFAIPSESVLQSSMARGLYGEHLKLSCIAVRSMWFLQCTCRLLPAESEHLQGKRPSAASPQSYDVRIGSGQVWTTQTIHKVALIHHTFYSASGMQYLEREHDLEDLAPG